MLLKSHIFVVFNNQTNLKHTSTHGSVHFTGLTLNLNISPISINMQMKKFIPVTTFVTLQSLAFENPLSTFQLKSQSLSFPNPLMSQTWLLRFSDQHHYNTIVFQDTISAPHLRILLDLTSKNHTCSGFDCTGM